jgi:hypothetical protein
MNTSQVQIGGAVVFFSTKDGTDRPKLKQSLATMGLEKFCPEERTTLSALKVALQELYGSPKTLIRPLDTNEREGFCVIEEERGAEGNSYSTTMCAYLENDQVLYIGLDHGVTVSERTALAKQNLPAISVSNMLVKLIEDLGGTALREAGGIYWLPENKLTSWGQISRIVEKCGPNTVYVLQHLKDENAIRAVRDAIVREAESESRQIEREINESEVGERYLQSRVDRAIKISQKIAKYEELLGVGLEAIKENLSRVEDAAAKAVLLASAVKEEPEKKDEAAA